MICLDRLYSGLYAAAVVGILVAFVILGALSVFYIMAQLFG